MPATLATLVTRTRFAMRDRADLDQLTASTASTGTSLTVADTTKYAVGEIVEVDYETFVVRALASGTALTVSRGAYDSTAASHASSASVLRKPAFTFADYREAINMGIDATWPLLYRPVVDESLTAVAGTYEYAVPNMPGTYDGDSQVIPYISKISVKWSGDVAFRRKRDWHVLRGTTPKLIFRADEAPGTIRIEGVGPFPYLALTTDTLDALFPKRAERLLTSFAANWLMASGEAGRVRGDSGAVDTREQANRPGSSMAAASALYQRFQVSLSALAMPPPHKENTRTF